MQSNRLTVDSQVGVDGQRCDFSDLVGSSAVVELVFQIAPRDIHSRRGVWVVNQKVKKNAEVVYRKLSKEDQAEFDRAMRRRLILMFPVRLFGFVSLMEFHRRE